MKTSSSAPQTLYLGLDVHKAETVIAILESERDAEPRHYGSIATTQHALERAMRRIAKKQNVQLSDLHVCYEASGCGFWIARRLLQMGVRCEVIAPSLIPVKSGDRVKTDKRDAMTKNMPCILDFILDLREIYAEKYAVHTEPSDTRRGFLPPSKCLRECQRQRH